MDNEAKYYEHAEFRRNFDDVFMRCVSLGVVDSLDEVIYWTNRFDERDIEVRVPFRYSLAGDENFLKDAYLDDVPSDERVNGNIDPVPRASVYPSAWTIASGEFTNPYIRVVGQVDDGGTIKRVTGQMKSVPMNITMTVEATLDSEIDAMKYSEQFTANVWPYRFFDFKYQHFIMRGVMNIPDGKSIEINRAINQTSDDRPKIKHSIDVKTYQPVMSNVTLANRGRIAQWRSRIWDARGRLLDDGARPDGLSEPGATQEKYDRKLRELGGRRQDC